MKKYFYLLALVCTLGFFTACSSDDDDDKKKEEVSALVGTWNVEPTVEKEEGLYDGSVRINWEGEAGTSINIDMEEDGIITMPLQTMALPLAANLANEYLPKVLKDVTFTQDGKINATFSEYQDSDDDEDDDEDYVPVWQKAEGYATYKIVSDNQITVSLDVNKVTANIKDAQTKAMVTSILSQYPSIPVNITWNADKTKAFFYVDKDFIQPLITNLMGIISQLPTEGLDEDDLEGLQQFNAIATQIPDIMNKTTKFEAGVELTK